jgi:hypothetical protein
VITSEWDANGAPIDRPQETARRSVADLFVAYREALSLSLSDGNIERLDTAHAALREAIKTRA